MLWSTLAVLAPLVGLSSFRRDIFVLLLILSCLFFTADGLLTGLTTLQVAVFVALIKLLIIKRAFINFHLGFLVYAIYSLFILLINSPPEIIGMNYTGLQSPSVRGFVSTAFHLAFYSFYLIASNFLQWQLRYNDVLRALLKICTFAMIFAVFQIFVTLFTSSANNFFSEFTRGFTFERDALPPLRPSPFTLEPRYFSFVMIFGLYLLIDLFKAKQLRSSPKEYTYLKASLFIFVVAACASASAVASALFGLLSIIVDRVLRFKVSFSLILMAGAIGAALLSSIYLEANLSVRFFRYFERLSEGLRDGSAELSTDAHLIWLSSNPISLVFGVGHGQSGFFALPFIDVNSGFFETGFLNSRVGLLDLVSSVGILGTVLIHFVWLNALSLGASSSRSSESRFLLIRVRSIVLFLIGTNLIFSVTPLIWIFLGVYTSLRKEQ